MSHWSLISNRTVFYYIIKLYLLILLDLKLCEFKLQIFNVSKKKEKKHDV